MASLRCGVNAPMAGWLREHLFGHLLPFWERHAVDDQGGLLTCITDAGKVISTDKWLWSQWRAVWVFSRIYNRLDRDPRWLRLAEHLAAFAIRSGWDEAGNGWALLLDRSGKILRGHESTYVDAFAIYGLTELFQANGDGELLALARRTADAALADLAQPYDRIPHFPYPIPPGAKPHGIPMLWSLKLAELGAVSGEARYLEAARRLSDEIFRDFYRPDRDLVLEIVRLDGGEFPAPKGTAVVPGHVIEDLWFQVHVRRLLGEAPDARTDEMFRLLLRHLDLGWDREHGGGLLLAVDADGNEPVGWNFADTKLWWPHTEALYSALLGWQHGGAPVFLDWYEKVWGYCLRHYVDWEHGEWRQKLNRDGTPITDVVALPVKDPFHLPRSLILQIEALEA
ncbi:MAG TPA: AGE family epimerase/isomerase [Chthoniobacteraceae bacterium]|nr:AGE family epimerase/isomerase [Chthoniobacteraceae bacterium]